MIIDETDNTDYFLYKYNLSNKNQKRIKMIYNFFIENMNLKTLTKDNMNRVFYYYGKEATLDIINFKIIKSKKVDNFLIELINHYENIKVPIMPISADLLMTKYEIPEGKQLGKKIKDYRARMGEK